MNNQLSHYISIEPDFFQELEGEFGVKITGDAAGKRTGVCGKKSEAGD